MVEYLSRTVAWLEAKRTENCHIMDAAARKHIKTTTDRSAHADHLSRQSLLFHCKVPGCAPVYLKHLSVELTLTGPTVPIVDF